MVKESKASKESKESVELETRIKEQSVEIAQLLSLIATASCSGLLVPALLSFVALSIPLWLLAIDCVDSFGSANGGAQQVLSAGNPKGAGGVSKELCIGNLHPKYLGCNALFAFRLWLSARLLGSLRAFVCRLGARRCADKTDWEGESS